MNKKEQILQAASFVFAEKGFHQATMDEIAEQARVAKGTLYYNYASKSKMFGATVTHGLEQIMEAVEQEMVSDLPFPEHFPKIVSTMVRLFVEKREVTRIFANELSSGIDNEVLTEIREVRQKFNTFVEAQLTLGQEKGYIKPLSRHLTAIVIIGIIDAVCSHYLEHPGQDTIDEITNTVFDILSTGLT